MSLALHAVCSACRIGGQIVRATHASRYGDGHTWCDDHAGPVDPPFAVAAEGPEKREQSNHRPPERRHDGWPLGRLQELEGY